MKERATLGRHLRTVLLVAVVIACSGAHRAAAETVVFPRPAELEPLITFWIEIFTQQDRDRTVIHDQDDPAIRYEVLGTGGMAESQRRNLVRSRRQHYEKILESLALNPSGKWTDEEKRVAALFPPHSGTSRFLRAAGSVHVQRGIRDQFREGLVRAGRWKPTVEGILASYGIPSELAALPHIESSYNPAATSKAGAVGIWQFTRRTGRRFMRIDRQVDERRDVYVSTHAAARYLTDAYHSLGSWPLTITSYNHGVEGMMRARREVGTTDIARLIREYDGPYFGFASKNFYAEFLAVLDVLTRRQEFFADVAADSLESVDRLVLTRPVRFPSVVQRLSIPEDELRRLNPALNDYVFEGRLGVPAGVVLNLPAGRGPDFAQALLTLPPAREPREEADGGYVVREGDTLITIARSHRVSVSALQAANGLGSGTRIIAGQQLTIPAGRR